MKRLLLPALLAFSPLLPAAEMKLSVELPEIPVSDYYRPYVAIWVEQDNQVAANLAVWYAVDQRDAEGNTWLKDMRLWWRRTGRELELPLDGLTSATRAPGKHELTFSSEDALKDLEPGDYSLAVEASREHGGREVVRVPFVWPPESVTRTHADGEKEFGRIAIELQP